MSDSVDLSRFDKFAYSHGRSKWMYRLWHLVNYLFFQQAWVGSSRLRVYLLRLFGAKIGKGVVMNKPRINIKYPWLLEIGDHTWIGENSWIYNMAIVKIGAHVNISQGVLLLTGNHNYRSSKFEVFTKPIVVEDGVFLGANATVCPGVTCYRESVLSVGSTATKNLEAKKVYQGNPAVVVKQRYSC